MPTRRPSRPDRRRARRARAGIPGADPQRSGRGIQRQRHLFPLLAIFALIAIGVGVILISQLTRLSIQERRREVAIASALGASPLITFGGFLAEAGLLGASGSVIGVLLGIVIAHPVVASASDLTQQFVGVNVPVVVEAHVVVAALGIGVLLALLAALLPSLSAAKTPIATELSGRATYEDNQSSRVWQKVAALLAIGFAGVILVWWATWSGGLTPWQAGIANVGVVVAIVGLLLAAAYMSAEILASDSPSAGPSAQRGHSPSHLPDCARTNHARSRSLAQWRYRSPSRRCCRGS